MFYYAVIDTNVIVSALLSKNTNSATVQVIREIFNGKIVPLYHPAILDEYIEVMRRPKFHLKESTIQQIMKAIIQ